MVRLLFDKSHWRLISFLSFDFCFFFCFSNICVCGYSHFTVRSRKVEVRSSTSKILVPSSCSVVTVEHNHLYLSIGIVTPRESFSVFFNFLILNLPRNCPKNQFNLDSVPHLNFHSFFNCFLLWKVPLSIWIKRPLSVFICAQTLCTETNRNWEIKCK